MNYEVLGKLITSFEQKARMHVKLEDHIRHVRLLAEQLCEQTLFECYDPNQKGDAAESALALAGIAMLVYEKLS